MAVNCCRYRNDSTEFKVGLGFFDTTNGSFERLSPDSVILRVLDAPNPAAADTFKSKIGFSIFEKRFFLNPADTQSRAELVYNGIADTLTVYYRKGNIFYDRCQSNYGLDINLYYASITQHWSGNKLGKKEVLIPYQNISGSNSYREMMIPIYFSK